MPRLLIFSRITFCCYGCQLVTDNYNRLHYTVVVGILISFDFFCFDFDLDLFFDFDFLEDFF